MCILSKLHYPYFGVSSLFFKVIEEKLFFLGGGGRSAPYVLRHLLLMTSIAVCLSFICNVFLLR